MGRCGIFVVAKKPEPGRVKTRMTPPLSPEQAAALSELCLRAKLSVAREAAKQAGAEVVLVVTPDEAAADRDAFGAEAGEKVWAQGDGDLGERLSRALRTAADEGFDRVLFLGMDSPTLSADQVRGAIRALDEAEVAAGPTDDGGYWTIGFRASRSKSLVEVSGPLLTGIDWGSDRVFAQTIAAAERSGTDLARLPAWYDLDRFDDLPRAREDLSALGESRAPEQTRLLEWIDSLPDSVIDG